MDRSVPNSSGSTDPCFGFLPWPSIVRDLANVLPSVLWFTQTQVDRGVNDNFKFNQETEFIPILGQIAERLNDDKVAPKQADAASSIQENHHPALLSLLAQELSVSPEEIHDFEL
jgi:aspartyl aminopeptidase